MKKLLLLLVCLILAITVILEILVLLNLYRIPYEQISILGSSYSTTHWMSWFGTLFIALSTPLQPLIKRKFPSHMKKILPIHMIGNISAVMFVSLHFIHQVTRSATNYPTLGTGIVLYTTMVLLVSTGVLMYSGIAKKLYKQLLFFHPAFAVTFYTIILMHILHGI